MLSRLSRPATVLLATAAGCLIGAGAAQAQAAGPRYLSWADRPTSTAPADVAAVQAPTRTGIIPRRVAPSRALARPAMQPFNPPLPIAERGLTPASAWLGARVTSSYAPGAPDALAWAEVPDPVRDLTPSAPTPPLRSTPSAPARFSEPAPGRAPAAPAAPTTPAATTPAPVAEAAADPMAPRRDAPIFRIGAQGQPAQMPGASPAAPAAQTYAQAGPAASTQQGARYYSVHRDAGRQPDPTPLPDPVFFDSVALDLAEPPPVQPPVRDAQGRRRPVANDDPSLP